MGEMTFYYALLALLIAYLPAHLYFLRSWRRAAKEAARRREQEPLEPLDPKTQAAITKAVRKGEAIQDHETAVKALDGWRRSGGFDNPVITGLCRDSVVTDILLAAIAGLAWATDVVYGAYFAAAMLTWSLGLRLYRWRLGRCISKSIDATRRLHGLD